MLVIAFLKTNTNFIKGLYFLSILGGQRGVTRAVYINRHKPFLPVTGLLVGSSEQLRRQSTEVEFPAEKWDAYVI